MSDNRKPENMNASQEPETKVEAKTPQPTETTAEAATTVPEPVEEQAPAPSPARRTSRRRQAPVDRRSRRLGRISVVTTIFAIALVILVNVVLETVVGDRLSWDLTQNKLMSISEVSDELLGKLNDDVRIVYLGQQSQLDSHRTLNFMPQLLNDYAVRSNGRVRVDYIDPVADPTVIASLDPQNVHGLQAGWFVVQNPGNERLKIVKEGDLVETDFNQNYQQVLKGYTAESALSGAINFVTKEVLPTIYELTGHGEPGLTNGYETLNNLMDANGYAVKQLNLMTSERVPEDATIVLVLAPQNDLTGPEADRLVAWVKTGGSILVAPGEFRPTPFSNLNRVLQEFNLELSNDRVREGDSSLHLPNYPTFVLASAPRNEITTQDVRLTLISEAAAVRALQNQVEWIETKPVLETSDKAQLEQSGDPENMSAEGKQALAYMSDNRGFIDQKNVKHSSRAVVLGSSTLFSDNTFRMVGNQYYNIYLSFYSLNWLSQGLTQEGQLMIPTKGLVDYRIASGGSAMPINIAAIATAVVLPLLLIVLAIVVYQRRKHL